MGSGEVKEESVTLFSWSLGAGRRQPAFFADAAEGALLSLWMEVTWRLLHLEAWLAQSSERLGLAVWPRCVRCDDCVLQ